MALAIDLSFSKSKAPSAVNAPTTPAIPSANGPPTANPVSTASTAAVPSTSSPVDNPANPAITPVMAVGCPDANFPNSDNADAMPDIAVMTAPPGAINPDPMISNRFFHCSLNAFRMVG